MSGHLYQHAAVSCLCPLIDIVRTALRLGIGTSKLFHASCIARFNAGHRPSGETAETIMACHTLIDKVIHQLVRLETLGLVGHRSYVNAQRFSASCAIAAAGKSPRQPVWE